MRYAISITLAVVFFILGTLLKRLFSLNISTGDLGLLCFLAMAVGFVGFAFWKMRRASSNPLPPST